MSRVYSPTESTTGGDDDFRYVERDDDGRAVVIAFIITLFVAKVVTSIFILIIFPSIDAALVVCALSVPWIIAAGWYFKIVGHVRLRLMRARAKRRKLIYEEWNVD
jgi:hypothetical protein